MKYLPLIAGILVTVSTFDTDASYIYTYAGNNYPGVYSMPNNNIDEISYTSDIYDTSMNLSITFTTDAPLINMSGLIYLSYDTGSVLDDGLINSFMFDDGYRATPELVGNPDVDLLVRLETGSMGNILRWQIWATYSDVLMSQDIHSDYGYVLDEDIGDDIRAITCTNDTCDPFILTGARVYDPGTWTLTQVPIPPALWLFGSGLLGLVGITRRKKVA